MVMTAIEIISADNLHDPARLPPKHTISGTDKALISNYNHAKFSKAMVI